MGKRLLPTTAGDAGNMDERTSVFVITSECSPVGVHDVKIVGRPDFDLVADREVELRNQSIELIKVSHFGSVDHGKLH